MAWFKVDDNFILSKKVLKIPRDQRALCIGFWTMAGVWSAHERTDGVVPEYVLDDLGCPESVIERLVDAGLWLVVSDPAAIVFHDWDEYQPTREQLEAKQAEVSAKRRAAGSKGAAKRWQTDSKSMANDSPEPEPEPEPLRTSSKMIESDFNIFWDQYPRKVAKVTARKAYIKARKTTDVALIHAGAVKLANDPNLPETTFIPHPATWLNRHGWEDEPYPDRSAPITKGYVTPSLPQPPRIEDLYCAKHAGYPAGQCDRCA